MKVGALGFALELNKTFSINLQLLGGIWILQIFPVDRDRPVHALVPPLRADHRLGGGHGVRHGRGVPDARATARRTSAPRTAPVFGHITYIAVTALALNLVLSVLFTLVFRAMRLPDGYDETRPADYLADPVPGSAIPAIPAVPHGALPRTAFQAGPAGPGGNNHSPPGAWNWHQLRGGHGKHSTRNGH